MKLYDTISAVTISIAMEHKLVVRNCKPHDPRDVETYERLKMGATFTHLVCRPGYYVEKELFFAEMEDVGTVGFINVLPELGIGRVVLEYEVDKKFSVAPILSELVNVALWCARELGAQLTHVSLSSTAAKDAEVLLNLGFREVRHFQELRLELNQSSLYAFDELNLRFRHLKPGEEAILAEIENLCFEGSWGFNPNTVDYVAWELRVKGNSHEDIILAEENGEIIGYCWPVIDCGRDSNTGKNKGRIYMLGVRPNQRSRGLGRKIILAGLRYLQDKGREVVEITVDSQNTSALELYRSIGFQPIEKTVWYEKVIE